jgi:hypothetical protein
MKKVLSIVAPVLLLGGLLIFSGRAPDAVYQVFPGFFPDPDRWWEMSPLEPGRETPARLPEEMINSRAAAQQAAQLTLPVCSVKQILFGDPRAYPVRISQPDRSLQCDLSIA